MAFYSEDCPYCLGTHEAFARNTTMARAYVWEDMRRCATKQNREPIHLRPDYIQARKQTKPRYRRRVFKKRD